MPIKYRLPEEIRNLTVCLFNASGSSVDTQYTFDSLANYIQDCAYQLEHGEKVKRLPYHVAPCRADALRAQEDFRKIMTALRKERSSESEADNNPGVSNRHSVKPDYSIHRADHAFIRGKA